jgi:DNA adenine methylase
LIAAINSPFRYAGGKFYARKLILEHIPRHTCYCEPFVGGGSIYFAKPKVARNILNDLDQDLMNVYTMIRDDPEGLIKFLEGLPASKELHAFYKNEFKASNDLEEAGRWYYLNRVSYSGIMNRQNCYWGYGG